MKEKIKKILTFIKENWFKLAILVAIFWFILLLQTGIEIHHSGWIENESPGLFFDF